MWKRLKEKFYKWWFADYELEQQAKEWQVIYKKWGDDLLKEVEFNSKELKKGDESCKT